jgi:purine-binding chemotaxis protein CheW
MTATLEAPRAVRACLFGLGGALFAVDVGHAREVVVLEDFTIVPLAPAHLLGLTNLRGYILPILDVRPLLGLRAHPVTRGSRLLVLDGGAGQVGVTIDGVQGLESFDQIAPLGDAARRRYGDVGLGLVERDGRPAILLDVPKVLEALQVGGVGERGETA